MVFPPNPFSLNMPSPQTSFKSGNGASSPSQLMRMSTKQMLALVHYISYAVTEVHISSTLTNEIPRLRNRENKS